MNKDGGSAFPSIASQWIGQGYTNIQGMTLLDYFAGKAMQAGLIDWKQSGAPLSALAERSYEVAQAMLSEKERLGGG